MSTRRMVNKGLGDRTPDAGNPVPGGRQDVWWRGKINLSTTRIGVDKILPHDWLRDPNLGRMRFGLKAIEFGNWMTENDRAHWLYGSMIGFDDLTKVFDIDPSLIGFDGRLSIALGARGRSRAAAHYEHDPWSIINLTKRAGRGSLAHEYGHALDNYLATSDVNPKKRKYISGYSATLEIREKNLETRSIEGLFENVYKTVFVDDDNEPTDFARALHRIQPTTIGKYWCSRVEIFARTFECWVSWRLRKARIINKFLVPHFSEDGDAYRYPSKAIIDAVHPFMQAIVAEAFSRLTDERSETQATQGRTVAVRTPDGALNGKYAVVDLSQLVTSHDPESWSADPRYPNGCQQRDYSRDPAEQLKVDRGSRQLEPALMITDTPSAVDGPPIVVAQGTSDTSTPTEADSGRQLYIVLGGNGRSMMLKRSVAAGTYDRYRRYLNENAHVYNVDPTTIDRLQHPVLVRVVEADLARCAYYSNVLNKALTQGIDHTTEAFSLARQITPAALELVAEILEQSGVETIADLFNDPRASRALIGVLRKARIITDTNVSQFLDRTSSFTDSGRLMVQSILLGALLEDARLAGLARSYTTQILRSAPVLLKIRKLGGQWDLMPLVRLAIEAESERRAAGVPKDKFLSQTSMIRPDLPQNVKTMWHALDVGPRKFATWVDQYYRRAATEAQGSGFGFSEPMNRDQILESISGQLADRSQLASEILSMAPTRSLAFGRFASFLGDRVPPTFSMLIWGQKYNGKSTFVMHLADELGIFGPVLLNSAEEPVTSASFRHRLSELALPLRNVSLDSISDWRTLTERVESGQYQFVIIDSIQKLRLYTEESVMLKYFVENRHRCAWIFVGRSDKDGTFAAGSSAWGFECDIEVAMKKFTATLIKHRYMDPRHIRGRRFNVLSE